MVVGAGPAGAAAALSVLAERPAARVLLLDRADFPRDKVCGDGVAAEVLDVLAQVGAGDVLDGWPVTHRLRITGAGSAAEGVLPRPGWVVPREVLDARIVERAVRAGAQLRRARVRRAAQDGDVVRLDVGAGAEEVLARVVVGADGAHSVVRAALTAPGGRSGGATAIALRGYAPVRPDLADAQVLRFATDRPRPAYAWSFPIGDGRANVGYGELLPGEAPAPPAGRRTAPDPWRVRAVPPTRAGLLAQLARLLPGVLAGVEGVAGHPLPLSTGRTAWGRDRVLLVGDAARLVNPISGEGIFYAVLSGVLAGRATAAALAAVPGAGAGRSARTGTTVTTTAGAGAGAGERYARAVGRELGRHLRATDLAARVVRSDVLLAAALRGSAADPRAFADLCDLALARGLLTPRVLAAAARRMPAAALGRDAGGARRGP